MIDNRQRRSVLIMMPGFPIMIYVGFASQPILSQKKVKLGGWLGFSKQWLYSAIYLYSNIPTEQILMLVLFLTTKNNNRKLIKSVIIMIHSEMNELAVFIEKFTHSLLSSHSRHLLSAYYLPCAKY